MGLELQSGLFLDCLFICLFGLGQQLLGVLYLIHLALVSMEHAFLFTHLADFAGLNVELLVAFTHVTLSQRGTSQLVTLPSSYGVISEEILYVFFGVLFGEVLAEQGDHSTLFAFNLDVWLIARDILL